MPFRVDVCPSRCGDPKSSISLLVFEYFIQDAIGMNSNWYLKLNGNIFLLRNDKFQHSKKVVTSGSYEV